MNDITKLAATAAIAAAALLASTDASAGTVQCDICTEQDMAAIANERIFELRAQGPLYIVNTIDGVVRKYGYFDNRTPDFDPEEDSLEIWTAPLEVEPGIQQAVAGMHGVAMEALAARPHINAPVGSEYPSDANDALINENYAQNMLLEIDDTLGGALHGRFAQWAEAFRPPFYDPGALKLPQVVKFFDGSSVVVYFDRSLQQWVIQPGSARDSNNNRIPLTPFAVHDGGQRNYNFRAFDPFDPDGEGARNHDDYMDLLHRMQTYHVPISFVGQPGSNLVRASVVCSPDGCIVQFFAY